MHAVARGKKLTSETLFRQKETNPVAREKTWSRKANSANFPIKKGVAIGFLWISPPRSEVRRIGALVTREKKTKFQVTLAQGKGVIRIE